PWPVIRATLPATLSPVSPGEFRNVNRANVFLRTVLQAHGIAGPAGIALHRRPAHFLPGFALPKSGIPSFPKAAPPPLDAGQHPGNKARLPTRMRPRPLP